MGVADEWISIADAAAEIGCSRTNIHQRIKAKAFEAKVVEITEADHQWRIKRSSFEKWKDQRITNSRKGKRIESENPGPAAICYR